MKLSWKEILRPTAVLFVICVAVAAALAGTIQYELLCAVSPRVHRAYLD